MANSGRKAGASKSEVISVIVIYILIVILIIFLTGVVLNSNNSSDFSSNTLIFAAAIILPGALLIYLIVYIYKLRKDIKRGYPGAKFKTHLILFFSIIILLSSIPQTIVSMRFVTSAINTWFSPKIGEAITGGLNLSLSYYNDKIDSLRNFGDGSAINSLIADIVRAPQRTWTNLKSSNPDIDSIQVFGIDGESLFFSGETHAEISVCPSRELADGMLPREDLENISLLRYLKLYNTNGKDYLIVLSSILPRNIDETAKSLTSAREVFLTYQKNQREFFFLLILFYAFFTIPLILVSILISFLLSDEILRPIISLEAATRKVSDGDYSYRILTRSGDELLNLTKSFNKMMNELENSRKKILQTEKITAWQEIARQLAHELRNPLTPIKLSAERVIRKYKNDPENIGQILEPAIQGIIQEVNGLDNLLREFRDFSRLPAPTLSEENIVSIIKQCLNSYKTSYPRVSFSFSPAEEIILSIDSKQIKQVFMNLLKNACESMNNNEGKIYIQTDLVIKGNSSYCRTRIQDSGCGIDPEKQEQVFNPYFTTKTEGTGLGLPIVERIIFDHKGQIWFESEPGHGTTFFVDLPVEEKVG
ncbi:MAG: ATP-binding protein [Spirochaetales bacterium]|nr:ATP-binding protein [Spirochaetales bacterium]